MSSIFATVCDECKADYEEDVEESSFEEEEEEYYHPDYPKMGQLLLHPTEQIPVILFASAVPDLKDTVIDGFYNIQDDFITGIDIVPRKYFYITTHNFRSCTTKIYTIDVNIAGNGTYVSHDPSMSVSEVQESLIRMASDAIYLLSNYHFRNNNYSVGGAFGTFNGSIGHGVVAVTITTEECFEEKVKMFSGYGRVVRLDMDYICDETETVIASMAAYVQQLMEKHYQLKAVPYTVYFS